MYEQDSEVRPTTVGTGVVLRGSGFWEVEVGVGFEAGAVPLLRRWAHVAREAASTRWREQQGQGHVALWIARGRHSQEAPGLLDDPVWCWGRSVQPQAVVRWVWG